MNHYTINTGHVFDMDGKFFDPAALAKVRELLPDGGPIPGFPAFRVEIKKCVWQSKPVTSFVVFRGRDAITMNMLCTEGLATLILPGANHQTDADLGWLADFEQCMALVLLEDDGRLTDKPNCEELEKSFQAYMGNTIYRVKWRRELQIEGVVEVEAASEDDAHDEVLLRLTRDELVGGLVGQHDWIDEVTLKDDGAEGDE